MGIEIHIFAALKMRINAFVDALGSVLRESCI